MKKRSTSLILDKLHRGFVITCIGMTTYGLYLLGWRAHRYFTVIRPARQADDLKLLQEGSNNSSTTNDFAPTLRT